MAVVDSSSADLGLNVGSSSRNFGKEELQGTRYESTTTSDSHGLDDPDQQNHQHFSQNQQTFSSNQFNLQQHMHSGNHKVPVSQKLDHTGLQSLQGMMKPRRINGVGMHGGQNGDVSGGLQEGFKRDMRELEDLLSKLNPMAEEFVPPSLVNHTYPFANNYMMQAHNKKNSSYNQGKRRINSRTSMAQREDSIRRTVYVSDIDHQVTEERLAALFVNCGQVVDCRVCGDPNSVLRFAFVEFTDEEGARAALSLAGTMLGYYPVRVLPSKTAIAPVNPMFLPKSEDEREMCARTIYCTNIDKKVSQAEVKLFFETFCGEVFRLRLLGDYHHSTRIAFVEFVQAESAIAALNCSGAVLGALPIRVSPSKTPVRPRAPRPSMH
ncbi:polyadenylate-binding protein-interacting protein 12 isoform X2 [Amborella trichopoda]|uniref:polyadenylate-binding protein-interacting protein 12 isoform X2 n=1 Tax=Amborella trichopoda TaxID=13333 RepID=UPI0009C0A386|nr:polyadenylate-binding protein-interacting protein 12 isoform X2 [Amborella trichopoda]|eukprot:XP_020518204.1 polyadenylate-binding protein-interacting protein 12 isoform X2 [Amborella trichopoda]